MYVCSLLIDVHHVCFFTHRVHAFFIDAHHLCVFDLYTCVCLLFDVYNNVCAFAFN